MAVGTNTYGTVARVQALVGDMVSGRVFSTTTTPTLAQVEAWLDDVAAELNMKLRSRGYTVPVANSGTDIEAFEYLRAANSAGAALLTMQSRPGSAFDPDAASPSEQRKVNLWHQYKRAMDVIAGLELPATRTSIYRDFFAGSSEDEDGNEKLPLFKRELHDYPGSRTLVDS